MNTANCIKSRRSIRSFTDLEIPEALIEEIVDAARYSPSWKNTQIARYTFIKSRTMLDSIAKDCLMGFTHNENIIKNAPGLVVISYIKGRSGFERDGSFTTSKGDRWQMFDCGIATQSFCLGAYEKGLGSVIMGIFDENKIAEKISLPQSEEIAALIAVGFPAENPSAPKRKETGELLRIL